MRTLRYTNGSFKIQYDEAIDVDQFIDSLANQLKTMNKRVIYNNIETIGAIVGDYILEEIRVVHPIGEFMAARTAYEVVPSGTGMFFLNFYGLKETQVNDRYTQRRKDNSKGYNLWEMFEYGGSSGSVEGKLMAFSKGGVGNTIYATKRNTGSETKYAGRVTSIIDNLLVTIIDGLKALMGELIDDASIYMVEQASKGQVKPQKQATLMLQNVNSVEALKKLGIVSQSISASGIIRYRNIKGQFAKGPASRTAPTGQAMTFRVNKN